MAATLPLCGIAASCGGGASTSSTPALLDRVNLVAYLDENRNGTMDSSEIVRVPGAEITLGPVTGRTALRSGAITLDVPRGSYPLSVREGSLPPYYLAPPARSLSTAEGGTLQLPITLPGSLGSLDQATYLAFGDSLTNGNETIGDGTGYREGLASMLRDAFGAARIENEGVPSSDSRAGARRLGALLTRFRPGFILILYGTNDWDDPSCRDVRCTADNLQSMVRAARSQGSLVFLGTLLPTNLGYDSRASVVRNEWIGRVNLAMADLARDEGVVLVDLHRAFGSPLSPSPLYVDSLHPTGPGYALMARVWFEAITVRR